MTTLWSSLTLADLIIGGPKFGRSASAVYTGRCAHVLIHIVIQVLRASTVASTHRNLGRQLVDGHWVLSFPDAEAAETARNLVDQHQVGHANM